MYRKARILAIMRMKGLEPPRLAAQDSKSCVSANSTTSAQSLVSLSLFWINVKGILQKCPGVNAKASMIGYKILSNTINLPVCMVHDGYFVLLCLCKILIL